ncbi:MAG: hypothetical protein EOO40_12085, partial [Deltaproteobacteria bacterium]
MQSPDLAVVPMSRFHADVAEALSRRGEALLLAPNLAERVAALRPLELYLMIKELGLNDALALVHCADVEQIRYMVDLDCWPDGEFSPQELDAWLAAFAPLGPKALAEAFLRVDEEIQVLFLAAVVTVYDLRSEEAEAAPGAQTAQTLDGFYLVEARDKARDYEVPPLNLVDALYRYDMNEGFRLLTAAKWELQSSLEEDALHFRTGRLEEMGFVGRVRAMQLFAPPPKGRALPKAEPIEGAATAPDAGRAELPALYAGALGQPGTLLSQAMAHVFERRTLIRLEYELVRLVGLAVVAYGNGPQNLQALERAAGFVRDTLSLGLEAQGAQA